MTRTVLAVVCSLLVAPGLAAGQTGRTAIAAFLTKTGGYVPEACSPKPEAFKNR